MRASKDLWKMYPESHLNFYVSKAGKGGYQVMVSLINHEDEVIASVEHFGYGGISRLKEEAFMLLAKKLDDSMPLTDETHRVATM